MAKNPKVVLNIKGSQKTQEFEYEHAQRLLLLKNSRWALSTKSKKDWKVNTKNELQRVVQEESEKQK